MAEAHLITASFLPRAYHGYEILLIEALLTLVACYVAMTAPMLGDGFFRRVEAFLGRFARRPVLSLLAVGTAPILLRLMLLPFEPMPQPFMHDEFSYLLNGDTFAHWRVTNPTHPLWVFFETMHVLQQPTYASQYQPGQGLFLAAGQILTGYAWAGVILSVGAMCAALFWMLRGWFTPGWALLGASIAIVRIGVFSYWMNSYWGGAVAAAAGALVAGAYPRLRQNGRARDGVMLGLGLVLLAASRPYEGFVFSVPFVVALLWRRPRARAWMALAAVAIPGVLALGYYNWRITGHPLLMPHQLKNEQYSVAPDFIFSRPRPEPHYNHAEMRDFYVREEFTYQRVPDSPWDFVKYFVSREKLSFWFFLGPVLALPFLLANPLIYFRGTGAVPMAGMLFLFAGLSLLLWPLSPHYHAPAVGVLYFGLILALQNVQARMIWKRPFGLFLVRSIPLVCLIMAVVRMFAGPLGIPLVNFPQNWSYSDLSIAERARILDDLRHRDGKSLVIARYLPLHRTEEEWVYNEADIDNAKVVWAQDMGPMNEALVNYFHDRKIYVIEPDVDRTRLTPYTPLLLRR